MICPIFCIHKRRNYKYESHAVCIQYMLLSIKVGGVRLLLVIKELCTEGDVDMYLTAETCLL